MLKVSSIFCKPWDAKKKKNMKKSQELIFRKQINSLHIQGLLGIYKVIFILISQVWLWYNIASNQREFCANSRVTGLFCWQSVTIEWAYVLCSHHIHCEYVSCFNWKLDIHLWKLFELLRLSFQWVKPRLKYWSPNSNLTTEGNLYSGRPFISLCLLTFP